MSWSSTEILKIALEKKSLSGRLMVKEACNWLIVSQTNHFVLTGICDCYCRRRRRTTFQRGVLRLQRQCEDEMIWPGVPRKLAFALRVRVSRNRSHSLRGPTGLHRHPHILIRFCCRGTLPVVDRTASAPTHFDSTSSFYCRTLSVVDPPPRPPLLAYARVIFYLKWPDHF